MEAHQDLHNEDRDIQENFVTQALWRAGEHPAVLMPKPRVDRWDGEYANTDEIRMPATQEVKTASQRGDVHVYAVRHNDKSKPGSVWCRSSEAVTEVETHGEVKRWGRHDTLAKNIAEAIAWVRDAEEQWIQVRQPEKKQKQTTKEI